jgi:glutathione S-transferase
MTVVMYERVGFEGRRPSPFSWRVRYALAHKGIPVEYRTVRFADVQTIRSLSGQDMTPIVIDGDTVVQDSWNIAIHLEERYAGQPSLFGGAIGRGLTRQINIWSDTVLSPSIRRLISADFIYVLAPEDREYFRRSREAQFGMTLAAYCADREHWVAALKLVIAPLEQTLSEQDYICGKTPAYADYLLFSVFQYARLGSPHELLPAGSAVRRWRDRLVGRFDQLGDRFPAYPANPGGPDGR